MAHYGRDVWVHLSRGRNRTHFGPTSATGERDGHVDDAGVFMGRRGPGVHVVSARPVGVCGLGVRLVVDRRVAMLGRGGIVGVSACSRRVIAEGVVGHAVAAEADREELIMPLGSDDVIRHVGESRQERYARGR
jgi:hypothetical protein